MALTLLHTALPFYSLYKGKEPDRELDLTPVMKVVHGAHQALRESSAILSLSRQASPLKPSVAQLLYRMSGWLLLDCMALTFGLLPAGEDAIDEGIWTRSWDDLQRTSVTCSPLDLSLDGVFHLVLDTLVYSPTSSSFIVQDRRGEQGIPDNMTGMSTEAWQRLDGRVDNWLNVLRWRQLKFVALKYVLFPSNAAKTMEGLIYCRNVHDGLTDSRKLVLAVLLSGDQSMHGRLASQYLNLLRVQGRGLSTGCSFSLAVYLLFLLLGEDAAMNALITKHSDTRLLWEPIVGSSTPDRGAGLVRSPLPLSFAFRVVDFLRDNMLLVADDPHVVDRLKILSALVVETQQTSSLGAFWGIQLTQRLFSESQRITSSSALEGKSGWRLDFYQNCLEIAKSVLSVVPDQEDSPLRIRSALHPRTREDRMGVPDGAILGDEQQGHLDVLVSNHRKLQKNRLLQRSDAVAARRVAYELIAAVGLDQANRQTIHDLCVAVFQWLACEEDGSNDATKSKALSVLLEATRTSSDREMVVFPLVPYLLVAACSDSPNARLAAIEWSSVLLASLQPDVASLVFSHLSCDGYDSVANEARRFKGELQLPSHSSSVSDPADEPICVDIRFEEGRLVLFNHLKAWLELLLNEFGLEVDASLALLTDHKFSLHASKESLREDYIGAISSSGLAYRYGIKRAMVLSSEKIQCEICYDELMRSDSYALPCNHAFCRTCWASYLRERFLIKSLAGRIDCPRHDCDERVLMTDVTSISEPVSVQWREAMLTVVVDKCDRFSPCPGPECSVVACCPKDRSTTNLGPVHCFQCGTEYCFNCKQKPHTPAGCGDFEHWNRIFSSSKYWIQTNTKPCPSCKVPIEKNMGCNHMHCSQCQFDFCWLCLSPLRNHMECHSCNAYNPLDAADNEEEQRAIFFTERFTAHEQAEAYCRQRLRHYEEEGTSVAERLWYLSGDQLNQLYDAAEVLAEARRFLQYSYVSAWARTTIQDPDAQRFTKLQATLENVTERLSTLVFTAALESAYRAQRLKTHFHTMVFLQEAVSLFIYRICLMNDEAKPKHFQNSY
jgi:ariadne-1